MTAKTEKEVLDILQKKTDDASQKKRQITFSYLDQEDLKKSQPMEKSIHNTIDTIKRGESIARLAFEEDPIAQSQWVSFYKPKRNLLPDAVLKTISNTDDLIWCIAQARSGHISAFGREISDRFTTGYRIEPRKGVLDNATKEQKIALLKRIQRASALLGTCGSTEGVEIKDQESLTKFLFQQARNAIIFGRFATEVTYLTNDETGEKEFHSFRSRDAGTIYQAAPKQGGLDQVRERALAMLARLQNEKLKPEKFENDEYAYVQVINFQPVQAFTSDEMYVWDVYPLTDVETCSYPTTPIDGAISAVITHLNITAHNKLYFQNGRAARGMVIIKSTDISQDMVDEIRAHFNASINSVTNSWRVPVFGCDQEDSIEWHPLEMQGARDMEYQYLADSNARSILSAFQMSPEELPGYQHLSRGTSNQALSESNQEYKLTAARDTGIRPLLNQFQDFLNQRILPLLDPELAKMVVVKLYGLDADTSEKEAVRIQQDMALHLTYDEILVKVEKDPIGPEMGGRMPLNPAYQSILDKYFTVGEVLEYFCGQKGAAQKVELNYRRDPFWFNQQQFLQQQQQVQFEMQQQQQQMAAQAQQAQQGVAPQEEQGGGEGGGATEQNADKAMEAVNKAERNVEAILRKSQANIDKIKAKQQAMIDKMMEDWEREAKQAKEKILNKLN